MILHHKWATAKAERKMAASIELRGVGAHRLPACDLRTSPAPTPIIGARVGVGAVGGRPPREGSSKRGIRARLAVRRSAQHLPLVGAHTCGVGPESVCGERSDERGRAGGRGDKGCWLLALCWHPGVIPRSEAKT